MYNLPKFNSEKAAKNLSKTFKMFPPLMHIAKNNGGRKRMQRA